MQDLLDRRLLIVLGKGGVGRTTLASAVALWAARAGQRVLLVGVDSGEPISQIFGARPGTGRPVELAPGLEGQSIELQAILDEFVLRTVKIRPLARKAIQSPLYRYFTAVAPGLRELLALDRIREAVEARRRRSPRYDLVVVDGPATGHGVRFLGVPRAALGIFKLGPLHRKAERCQALLQDRERTAALLVSLAEEMPVRESLELHQSLTGELGVAVGALILNAVYPEPLQDFPDDVLDSLLRPRSKLRRTVAGPLDEAAGKGSTRLAAEALEFALRRRNLNVAHMDHLLNRASEPYFEVAYLPPGVRPISLVERVAEQILGPLPPKGQP